MWGSTPTDKRFTGQIELPDIGLYDYGARAYSPLLGRFISADTLVPRPSNSQSLNRYSYVLGNPLKYTDPTGHDAGCPGDCNDAYVNHDYEVYGFRLEGFTEHEVKVLAVVMQDYATEVGDKEQLGKLMGASGDGSPVRVWKDPYNPGADTNNKNGIRLGTTTFQKQSPSSPYTNYETRNGDERAQVVFGHEIGHRLLGVLRPAKDWAAEYQKSVPREDGKAWSDTGQAEQEAVTNLSLGALARSFTKDYSISTFPPNQKSTNQRHTKIESWRKQVFRALSTWRRVSRRERTRAE